MANVVENAKLCMGRCVLMMLQQGQAHLSPRAGDVAHATRAMVRSMAHAEAGRVKSCLHGRRMLDSKLREQLAPLIMKLIKGWR